MHARSRESRSRADPRAGFEAAVNATSRRGKFAYTIPPIDGSTYRRKTETTVYPRDCFSLESSLTLGRIYRAT